MAVPCTFLAALPKVWIRLVLFLKNPSLSASSIATSDTSGMSSPSLRRFMPTSTSKSPSLSCLISSVRCNPSISECKYLTRTSFFAKYSAKSSAILFVSVVTSTRSPFFVLLLISEIRSSIWFFVGLTSTTGSKSPVGRTSCSAIWNDFSLSYSDGVADTKMQFLMYCSNSSNFNGLLSNALGSLKP